MPFAKHAQRSEDLESILFGLSYCYLNADLLEYIQRLVADLAFVDKFRYSMYFQFVRVMLDW